MQNHEVKCAYNSKDDLGESPIWVEEQNSIFWVDIKKCIIHKLNTENYEHTSWTFNEQIGCIAHINRNKFIAGTKNGFKFVDLNTNKLEYIINPETNLKNNKSKIAGNNIWRTKG